MKELYNKNKIIIHQIYQIREYINKQDDVGTTWLIMELARRMADLLSEVIEKKAFFSAMGADIDE